MRRKTRVWVELCIPMVVVVLIISIIISGCVSMSRRIRPSRSAKMRVVNMVATGYDSCGSCCNWKRSWFGLGKPVIASGSSKGKPKAVGVTASGSDVRKGTIAADTRYYPFGTVMYIPGYGYGRVEDRGGAIKGPNRIDLYFSTHKKALKWGKQRVKVKVWEKR